ncbi:MAG: hypothetical protein ACM3NH_00410 [Candidatus Saccharibacteria bacterium]
MGKKPPRKPAREADKQVSFARVRRGEWPEALERLREEAKRAERITGDDLKVIINT